MAEGPLRLPLAEARAYAREACLAVGASEEQAQSLAEATVAAEAIGRRAVGFAHLADYLEGFVEGRIARDAAPKLWRVRCPRLSPAMRRAGSRS